MTNEYRDQFELAVNQARDRMSAERNDALFSQAKRCVIETQRATISFLQRTFGIGYNEAANVITRLELEGVVSVAERLTGKRTVLIQPVGAVAGGSEQ